MSKKKTAVKEPQSFEPAVYDPATPPAFLRVPPKGRGHEEEALPSQLEMPRAKLLQFTSGEVKREENPLKPGVIINSISQENLPPVFIPIFKYTEWIRWNPRQKDNPNFDPAFDPGALIFRTNQATDPRVIEGAKFGPGGEPPAVTEYLNFFSMFIGEGDARPQFLVLPFAKTSHSAGKKLYNQLLTQGGDMFLWKHKLSSARHDKGDQSWFQFVTEPAGKATEDEYRAAEWLYESYRKVKIVAHVDEEDTQSSKGEEKADDQKWDE